MKDKEIQELIEWVKEVVKTQHNEPSPLTLEKFNGVTESLKDFKSEVRADLQDLRDTVERRYAAKWVEKVAVGMVGAILLYFLGGLLGMWHIDSVGQAIGNIIRFIC